MNTDKRTLKWGLKKKEKRKEEGSPRSRKKPKERFNMNLNDILSVCHWKFIVLGEQTVTLNRLSVAFQSYYNDNILVHCVTPRPALCLSPGPACSQSSPALSDTTVSFFLSAGIRNGFTKRSTKSSVQVFWIFHVHACWLDMCKPWCDCQGPAVPLIRIKLHSLLDTSHRNKLDVFRGFFVFRFFYQDPCFIPCGIKGNVLAC